MLDPCLIPGLPPKVRRQCCNPLCGKLLSALNKQDLCFHCHGQAQLKQLAVANYRTGSSKFLR